MSSSVSETFLAFALHRIGLTERDIVLCVDRLTEEQLWQRHGDHENSVANLLLHLEGNARQWVLHGIAGQPDVRHRDGEFTLVPTVTGAEALARFRATLEQCRRVIGSLPSDRLLETINPQPGGTWAAVSILGAIFQVTAHLQQHMGQIVLLTKQMTATDLDLSMPRKR